MAWLPLPFSDGSYEPEVDAEGSSFSDDVLGSASEVDEPINKRQKTGTSSGAAAAQPQIKPKPKRVAASKKPTAAKAPALPKLLKV